MVIRVSAPPAGFGCITGTFALLSTPPQIIHPTLSNPFYCYILLILLLTLFRPPRHRIDRNIQQKFLKETTDLLESIWSGLNLTLMT